MRVGTLVEWKGSNGEIEEGYGVVINSNKDITTVYWLRIEDETHLSLAEGTVTYSNSDIGCLCDCIVEVICK